MHLSKQGLANKMGIGLLVFFITALALLLPLHKKHLRLSNARQAAQRGKEIAFLLDKHRYKRYQAAPDFTQMELSFECKRKNGGKELSCDDYSYFWENEHTLRVAHHKIAQWFEIDVQNGSVICNAAPDSDDAKDICRHTDVPSVL